MRDMGLQMRQLIANAGGRRFLMTIGCGVITSFLLFHGKLTPETYRDIIIATLAVYIGGNTYQKTKGAQD